MRATRNRPFPRPAPFAAPVVRHEVWMVPNQFLGKPAAKRLAGGIALRGEAEVLFAQACRDMLDEPGDPFNVVLERHTIETLAFKGGCGDVIKAAERPAEIHPLPTTGADEQMTAIRRFSLAAIAKAFGVPMRFLREYDPAAEARRQEADALEVARHIGEVVNRLPYTLHRPPGREPSRMPDLEALLSGNVATHVIHDEIGEAVEATRTPPLSSYERHMEARPIYCEWEPGPDSLMGGAGTVNMSAVLIALFTIAAHHQGGVSAHARQMGEALGVPVPFTMTDLSERAMAVGLTPALLWPWREVPGCRDADVAAMETSDKGEACSSCGMFAAFGHYQTCPHAAD